MEDELTNAWQASEVERLRATPREIADRLDAGTLVLEPIDAAESDPCLFAGCDESAIVTVRFTAPSGARGFLRSCGVHTMQALYRTHRAR